MDYEPENDQLADIDVHLEKLVQIQHEIIAESVLTEGGAYLSEMVLRDNVVLEAYFTESPATAMRIALETISAGIIAAVAAGVAAIAAVIWKIISHFRKKDAVDGDKATKAAAVVASPELRDALKEGFAAAGSTSLSLEDEDGVKTVGIFDDFKNSLNDGEVDFLTSSIKHRQIKNAIRDFTDGNFHEFAAGAGNEITKWVTDGLVACPNVGKDEDHVNIFKQAEQRKVAAIDEKYSGKVTRIQGMERDYLMINPKGDSGRLEAYHRKPSELFPYLENVWKEMHFSKISDKDRLMIDSLEEVKRDFENVGKKLRPLTDEKRMWPAEEAFLKLAHYEHSQLMKNIILLTKIVGFIRGSANTAYSATRKSFSYITRVLNEVSRMPNVDRSKVLHAIEVITRKHKELNEIIHLT